MVTAQDVADYAGVSRSTVSYVMNNSPLISESTTRKVKRAAAKLSYHLNIPARKLAGGLSGFIGLDLHINPGTSSADSFPHLSSVMRTVRQHHGTVLLMPGEKGIGDIQKISEQSTVDGLLIYDIRLHDDRLHALSQIDLPTVLVGTPDPSETCEIPRVDINYHQITLMAINELRNCGCNSIIFFDSMKNDSETYNFSREFDINGPRLSNQMGLAAETRWLNGRSWDAMARQTADCHSWIHRHVGVAIRTPHILNLFYSQMLMAGLRIGQDIPVIAVCSDTFAQEFPITISNINPMAEECSRQATELLYRLINADSHNAVIANLRKTAITVLPQIHRRQSSAQYY